MAEVVTRRYVERATGAPITGALIRLVNKIHPNLGPWPMVEIVSTDPNKQGYYHSSYGPAGAPAYLEHGVYIVERDFDDGNGYVPWEGEETVEPGFVEGYNQLTSFLLDDLAYNQVRAIAYAGTESGATGTLDRLKFAVDVAALRSGRVLVGAWGANGTNVTWTGSSLATPDKTDYDLSGARLEENASPNSPVLSCAGDVTVRNGFLKITSADGLGRVVTMQNVTKRAIFIGVTFERTGTAAPTVAGTSNQECPAIFIGCKNVVLAPATPGAATRKQCAIGCDGVYEVGGAAVVQLDQANITGQDLGLLVRTALATAGTTPDAGLPFSDMGEFAEAVKYLWNTKIPALEAKDQELENAVGVATAESGVSWEWERANNADGVLALTIEGPGSVTGITTLHCYEKAFVRGTGKNAMLTIQCAAVFTYTLSNSGGSKVFHGGAMAFDLVAFEAALAAKYPAWAAAGGFSKRYNEGGLPNGLYIKRALRAIQPDSDVSANRLTWESIDVSKPTATSVGNDVGFLLDPYKGIQVAIPLLPRNTGFYRAAVLVEYEVPAYQTGTYANDGALGTAIGFPYAI